MIRRNPDAKWKLTPEFILNIKKTQQEILDTYSPIVKKEGIIIYSTCSILPSENTEQISGFLNQKKDQFVLQEEKKIFPSETGFDGFYIAKLKRIH